MDKIIIMTTDDPYNESRIGGKNIHVLNFYRALKDKGYDVEVIAFDKIVKRTNLSLLFAIVKYKLRYRKQKFNLMKNFVLFSIFKYIADDLRSKLLKILKRRDLKDIYIIAEDVIAINVAFNAGISKERLFSVLHGYITYESIDYKYLIDDPHDVKYFLNQEELAYSRCARIVTVDSAIKDYLINKMNVPVEKIAVIYNSIDVDRFQTNLKEKNDLKKEILTHLQLPNNQIVILIPRRLVNKNGVIFAVKAMYDLQNISKEAYNETVMIVCGDGIEKASIVKTINELKLKNKVFLLGNVDYDKMTAYFKGADIVIIPSIYSKSKFAEATSLAALEGMASKNIVIVTNVGGLKEIVRNNDTGYVVVDKSSKKIAEKIAEIFDPTNSQIIEEIRKNSQEYVINNHNYVNHADKILSFFMKNSKN